jgi:hypothetical protein
MSKFPEFSDKQGTINVDRLLKIRESRETRDFRDWLGNVGAASDAEIKDRVASLRALIGLKISSPSGQAIRFLATSAAGFVPHAAPTALALGVFNQFILDEIFPRSGVAAFVNELYPSIFEQSRTTGGNGAAP